MKQMFSKLEHHSNEYRNEQHTYVLIKWSIITWSCHGSKLYAIARLMNVWLGVAIHDTLIHLTFCADLIHFQKRRQKRMRKLLDTNWSLEPYCLSFFFFVFFHFIFCLEGIGWRSKNGNKCVVMREFFSNYSFMYPVVSLQLSIHYFIVWSIHDMHEANSLLPAHSFHKNIGLTYNVGR